MNNTERMDAIHEVERLANEQDMRLDFVGGIVTVDGQNFDWTEQNGVEKTLEWLQEGTRT